jgi:hypothetical protein
MPIYNPTDSNGDLRLVAPYMLTAMKPYLAVNTKQLVKVEINSNNPELQVLLGNSQSYP